MRKSFLYREGAPPTTDFVRVLLYLSLDRFRRETLSIRGRHRHDTWRAGGLGRLGHAGADGRVRPAPVDQCGRPPAGPARLPRQSRQATSLGYAETKALDPSARPSACVGSPPASRMRMLRFVAVGLTAGLSGCALQLTASFPPSREALGAAALSQGAEDVWNRRSPPCRGSSWRESTVGPRGSVVREVSGETPSGDGCQSPRAN